MYKVLYLRAVLTSLLNDMQFLTFRAHVIRALVLHAVSHPFPCARPCAAEDPVRQTPLPQPVRFSSRVLSPGRCRAHARAFEWNTPTWSSEPRPAPMSRSVLLTCCWAADGFVCAPSNGRTTCRFQRLHVFHCLHTKPRFHAGPYKELM
jgi:hypothetical protein